MAVTRVQKRRIKEEAGNRCAIPNCNVTSPLDIHHIQYQENGGSDEDDNLICLCRNCHGRVHNNDIEDISIRTYKRNLVLRSARLFPHEVPYLEALLVGEQIELDEETVVQVRRLERNRFIRIQHLRRNDVYRLSITQIGRELIE
ncbi:MAG: HNH endonuclease [Bacteroidales bacterium]|nr:HNH endonuclease [Bacteroidales bacterium]